VEHCVGPLGVGTLIVKPNRHVLAVGDLRPEEQAELGPLLAHVSRVVRELTAATQVYVCLWSHGPVHIHFVVQPELDRLLHGPAQQAAQFALGRKPDVAQVEAFAARARVALAPALIVRELDPERDAEWVQELCHGETRMARRGELLDVLDQPGLVAARNGIPAGLLAYRPDNGNNECELFFIAAIEPWTGAGTALVEELLHKVVAPGTRVWVVTTNDNVDALRFYQRRGFRLREVRSGAVDDVRRRLKPTIPEIGNHGVAIRDEVELELTT
jgi:diadenosine tetraphosphate (Ap4A) HIT family hydrolase